MRWLYTDMKGLQDMKILLMVLHVSVGKKSTYPRACTCRESSGTILTLVPHL